MLPGLLPKRRRYLQMSVYIALEQSMRSFSAWTCIGKLDMLHA